MYFRTLLAAVFLAAALALTGCATSPYYYSDYDYYYGATTPTHTDYDYYKPASPYGYDYTYYYGNPYYGQVGRDYAYPYGSGYFDRDGFYHYYHDNDDSW